jgi:hypothetical protein
MKALPSGPAWRYAVAGALAAVIAAGTVVWRTQTAPRDAGGPGAGPASATGGMRPPATIAPGGEGPVAGPHSAAALASAPATPSQVHEMFVQAVLKAREAPPVPPPGIAQARSFDEAFEAMRAAQPEPAVEQPRPAPINPFGAVR